MKVYKVNTRTLPARVERVDTLSQFFFKSKLWLVSPLWLTADLFIAFIRGKMWVHKRGTMMETRKISVAGSIISFATTVKRMAWLDAIGFFESEVFVNEMIERKRVRAEAKKQTDEIVEGVQAAMEEFKLSMGIF